MNTALNTKSDLIERVNDLHPPRNKEERAAWWAVNIAIARQFGDPNMDDDGSDWPPGVSNYLANVDRALEMAGRVLPGVCWEIFTRKETPGAMARFDGQEIVYAHDTPALAVVSAMLHAAKDRTQGEKLP